MEVSFFFCLPVFSFIIRFVKGGEGKTVIPGRGRLHGIEVVTGSVTRYQTGNIPSRRGRA